MEANKKDENQKFFSAFQYSVNPKHGFPRSDITPLTLDRFKVNTLSFPENSATLFLWVTGERCEIAQNIGVKMTYRFKSAENTDVGEEKWILLPFKFDGTKNSRAWCMDIPVGAVKVEMVFTDAVVTYNRRNWNKYYGFDLLASAGISGKMERSPLFIELAFDGVKVMKKRGLKSRPATSEDIVMASDVILSKVEGMTSEEAENLISSIPTIHAKNLYISRSMYFVSVNFGVHCNLDLDKYREAFRFVESIEGIHIESTMMSIPYKYLTSIQYFTSNPYSRCVVGLVKLHSNLKDIGISKFYDYDEELDTKFIENEIECATGRLVRVFDA